MQKIIPHIGTKNLNKLHGTGKASAASILKNKENIQKEFGKVEAKSRESENFLKVLFFRTVLKELTFLLVF